jgi:hypothetical protein
MRWRRRRLARMRKAGERCTMCHYPIRIVEVKRRKDGCIGYGLCGCSYWGNIEITASGKRSETLGNPASK